MATESFFEDMVIDTPEAAENLEALIASGVKWKRGDTVFTYGDPKESCSQIHRKWQQGVRLMPVKGYEVFSLSRMLTDYDEVSVRNALGRFKSVHDSAT